MHRPGSVRASQATAPRGRDVSLQAQCSPRSPAPRVETVLPQAGGKGGGHPPWKALDDGTLAWFQVQQLWGCGISQSFVPLTRDGTCKFLKWKCRGLTTGPQGSQVTV